jgi:hypothetical protein
VALAIPKLLVLDCAFEIDDRPSVPVIIRFSLISGLFFEFISPVRHYLDANPLAKRRAVSELVDAVYIDVRWGGP